MTATSTRRVAQAAFLIAAVLVASVQAAFLDAYSESAVRQLAPHDFDAHLAPSTDVWIVQFYAPYSPLCKRLAPVWVELAGKLRDGGSPTQIAIIDADEHREFSRKFNIEGYPTIVTFGKHSKSAPETYDGEHTLDELLAHVEREEQVTEEIGRKKAEAAEELRQAIEAKKAKRRAERELEAPREVKIDTKPTTHADDDGPVDLPIRPNRAERPKRQRPDPSHVDPAARQRRREKKTRRDASRVGEKNRERAENDGESAGPGTGAGGGNWGGSAHQEDQHNKRMEEHNRRLDEMRDRHNRMIEDATRRHQEHMERVSRRHQDAMDELHRRVSAAKGESASASQEQQPPSDGDAQAKNEGEPSTSTQPDSE